MITLLAQGPLPVGSLIALLIFGIAFLLVLILRFKMQAFLALICLSIVVAIGAVYVNGKPEEAKVTAGSWSPEGVRLTIPAHGREVGAKLALSGAEPVVYNSRTYEVAEVIDADSVLLAEDTRALQEARMNAGPIVLGGEVRNPYAVNLANIGGDVGKSMGSALGFLATIIGIGAIFGALLEHSGGTQAIAKTLLRMFGDRKAPWAMLLTGFIVSIPVFLDVALVILAPILYALARDTKKSLLIFGLPLVAGMAVTHAFVPPTPGPVAVAVMLDVNLGWVILFGVLVGLPTALICGPPLCRRVAGFVDVSMPLMAEEGEEIEEAQLPPFALILGLIALPILLILARAVLEQKSVAPLLGGMAPIRDIVLFVGHPIIALLGSTLLAGLFLSKRRGASREQILDLCTKALGPAGIIILITGAGGVFKGVLSSTGIAVALKDLFENAGISVLILAWIFATLVRIAQGSATVAMLTAAGLMQAFVGPETSNQLKALITVAIASGATGFSHVNDSGFWMISRYLGMNEKQTLKTWSVVSIAISLVSFFIILLLSFFVSLL